MSVLAFFAAVAATTSSYDCTIETPQALSRTSATSATINPIGFPEGTDDWKFRILVSKDDKGAQAEVIWPKNPIQIAGKYAALPIAEGSLAFVAMSGGPCLFTDQACATMVQLVDQPGGTATILLTPTALSTEKDTGKRSTFIVLTGGICNRSEKSK
ncbi:hypothetical protein [Sphingomonas psychrotolerans]|uniref:Uncharacterized protein n=1 Tax=Sphingomonas psychrotolerans TaxID=1327635 RepID=A0A2K8MBT0_9SPHN|nr:hypothetical protein [Sphingomonas psychrotolerans]ATY31313.1 hypothetical protein CVN68_04400 [Sphingomonas psychrotolerans]